LVEEGQEGEKNIMEGKRCRKSDPAQKVRIREGGMERESVGNKECGRNQQKSWRDKREEKPSK
jgi:hypothetical protein